MSALIDSDAITQIVSARDAAWAEALRAADLRRQAWGALDVANDLALRAHGGSSLYLGDRGHAAREAFTQRCDIDAGLDAYRRSLDGAVWMHVASRTGMDRAMDHEAKEAYYAMLQKDPPVVTEQAVRDAVEGARAEAGLYFLRGLAKAFASLDRRFKSHDAFMFSSRIIFTNLYQEDGHLSWYRQRDEMLADIDRCFSVIAGEEPDWPRFRRELIAARREHYGDAVETRWFRVRAYVNGNAHLWVRDKALLRKVNEQLALYYGAVLPDAVTPEVTPEDARSKTGALSKDLAFYPTPKKAALVAVEHLLDHWYLGEARVLEPSAGEGHLALALLGYIDAKRAESMRESRRFPDLKRETGWNLTVHAVEVHPERVAVLYGLEEQHPRLSVREANFLQLTPTGDYDGVLMNPPFYGTHCLEHVMHAFDFLRPGGRLAAILPATAQVRETKKHKAFAAWLKGKSARWTDLPPESFSESGTRVATVVLTLEKSRR